MKIYFDENFSPKKGWNYWSIIQLIVKLWHEITAFSIKNKRPFAGEVKVTTGKLKPLN